MRSSESAGFEWRESGCSACLGMNPDILSPGERCASTSNRNFEGRQGAGGRTHLVSPKMAAAAAVEGRFVDIREWELACRWTRSSIIEGRVAVLDRSDVDTDQIIPKQFLKRIERTGFGEFLFYDWFRSGEIELEAHPILVTGRNFGSGSSREHAVWALKDYGFDAVIAPSFSDIFYSNCTKNGLLPVVLDEEHCRAVAGAGEARIDLDDQTVNCAEGVFPFEIDEDIKHRLINGLDDVAMTLSAPRRSTIRAGRAGRRRPGHDVAVSAQLHEHGPPRVGRPDLRPDLRAAVPVGPGGAGAPRPAAG